MLPLPLPLPVTPLPVTTWLPNKLKVNHRNKKPHKLAKAQNQLGDSKRPNMALTNYMWLPLALYVGFVVLLYADRWMTRRRVARLGHSAPDVGIPGPLGKLIALTKALYSFNSRSRFLLSIYQDMACSCLSRMVGRYLLTQWVC